MPLPLRETKSRRRHGTNRINEELAVLLLAIGILFTAGFSFINGYWLAGTLALAGFSRTMGMISLIASTIVLMLAGEYTVGLVPVGLVVFNVVALLISRRHDGPL